MPAMTHRLHWHQFDRGTGKHASGQQDFASLAEAEAAKAMRKASDPDAAVMVTPIRAKATPIKAQSQKIGRGHPEWQGERRVTR